MLFLGITDAATARRLVARGRFHAACAGDLAALCAEQRARPSSFFFPPKPHPLERLLDVQRLLEAAAEQGPILAATPGTQAESADEALAALGGDLSRFAEPLGAYGRACEYQVAVAWDARASLAALAAREAPELAAARALGRERFGEAIARAMTAERARFADAARTALQAVALDLLELPTPGEDQIANIIVMIGPDGGPALDAALERLDADLPGEPRIRCVGPLPAHSFVAIELKRADAAAMARARDALGVAPGASPEALKAAFRAKARTAHPDAGGDPERFRALVEARTRLAAFAGGDAVASLRRAGGASR
jgi:hypothetical protein